MKIECAALLFDLDGVLVDSRAVIRRHWTRWSEKQGLDIERVLAIAHGRRPADTVRLLLPQANNPEELAEDIVAGEASDAEGLVRLPGVCELIGSLPAGRWTVATSGPRAIAEFRLRFANVPVLSTLVTAEDVNHGKPDPEPYLLAARNLQVSANDCVVIEDAPPGVKAGRAAGAQVIGLSTTHLAEDLWAAGANFVTDDLSSLEVHLNAETGWITLCIESPGQRSCPS